MAARFKLPLEVLLSKYGEAELYRNEDFGRVWYCTDKIAEMKYNIEMISTECRKSICGAKVMKLKDLISSGLAQTVSVYTLNTGDSYNHRWVRPGVEDLCEGTYSKEW